MHRPHQHKSLSIEFLEARAAPGALVASLDTPLGNMWDEALWAAARRQAEVANQEPRVVATRSADPATNQTAGLPLFEGSMVGSVDSDEPLELGLGEKRVVSPLAAPPPFNSSVSPIWQLDDHTIPDFANPQGTSTLARGDEQLLARLDSEVDFAGAYTLWWIVFNKPQNCENAADPGCGPADVFDAVLDFLADPTDPSTADPTCGGDNICGDADVAVGFAAGHAIGAGGHLSFAARLQEGEPLDPTGFPLPPQPLRDTQSATVHLVARYHGEVEPGRVQEQLRGYELGLDCDPTLLGTACPRSEGATGDVQLAIHEGVA